MPPLSFMLKMKQYTFRKYERLCSKRCIQDLYTNGERLMSYPFSVVWCVCDKDDIPSKAQVIISASKKKMKHAVDRNHTKRVIRECYRLYKEKLYTVLDVKGCKILLAINYIQNKQRNYASMERKYIKMLDQLIESINKYQIQ